MFRVTPLLSLLALAACSPSKLSNEQLNAVVAAHSGTLDACYDAALEREPLKRKLLGDATLVIAPSGEVTSVDVRGDLPLPGLKGCLEDAIAGWRFPEAAEKTRTALPLIFEAQVVVTEQP